MTIAEQIIYGGVAIGFLAGAVILFVGLWRDRGRL